MCRFFPLPYTVNQLDFLKKIIFIVIIIII